MTRKDLPPPRPPPLSHARKILNRISAKFADHFRVHSAVMLSYENPIWKISHARFTSQCYRYIANIAENRTNLIMDSFPESNFLSSWCFFCMVENLLVLWAVDKINEIIQNLSIFITWHNLDAFASLYITYAHAYIDLYNILNQHFTLTLSS